MKKYTSAQDNRRKPSLSQIADASPAEGDMAHQLRDVPESAIFRAEVGFLLFFVGNASPLAGASEFTCSRIFAFHR